MTEDFPERWSYRRALASAKRHDPFIRAVRQDMADVYRKVRADNPAMARLLFRWIKATEAEIHTRMSP